MDKKTFLRVTTDEDLPFVNTGMESWLLSPFFPIPVPQMMESAFVSVCLVEDNKTVAHASFTDFLHLCMTTTMITISTMSEDFDWTTWMAECLNRKRFNCANTLFLQTFICESNQRTRLQLILTEMFKAQSFLQYIVLVSSKELYIDPAIKKLFVPKKMNSEWSLRLWVCPRKKCIPLNVRNPKMEDHSDLLRLTETHKDILVKSYGSNFTVDIANYNKTDTFAVIGENEGSDNVVGFAYASSKQINLRELNANFELETFHGLRKPKLAVAEELTTNTATLATDDESSENPPLENPPDEFPKLFPRQSAYMSGHPNREKWLKEIMKSENRDENNPHRIQIAMKVDPETTMIERFQFKGVLPKHLLPKFPEPNLTVAIPEYKGKINCFRIYYFVTECDFETEFLAFMMSMFKRFQNLTYCLLLTPYNTPLLSFFQLFFHVPTRPLSRFPQAVFLFHKAGVLSDFNVRKCIKLDFPKIKYLVESLYSKYHVLSSVKEFLLEGHAKGDVFVATCHKQLVGVVVMKPEKRWEYVRSHFSLPQDADRYERRARLCHCILNPALKFLSKVFLREVMRIANKTALFYRVYPARVCSYDSLWHSGCNVLDDLLPLPPLRPIQYCVDQLGQTVPTSETMQTDNGFAVFFTDRKMCFFHRRMVIQRIVLVGASEAGLGFLETLMYSTKYLFKNLMLISPCGLPGEIPPNERRNCFLPNSVAYDQDRLDCLGLHALINVICGRMKAIKRAEKLLVLETGAEVAYDYLIIACGLQYPRTTQKTVKVKYDPKNDEEQRQTCLRISQKTFVETAGNLFSINDIYDAAVALKWLGDKFNYIEGKLIIYGNSVEAYTCLSGVLKISVPPEDIIFAHCKADKTNVCFHNKTVEDRMLNNIEKTGVTVYMDCQIDVVDKGDYITAVRLTNRDIMKTIVCRALFFCHEKKVDYAVYNACLRAKLKFDGRLMVDQSFKTNDDFIYGAGTITKFYDTYYAMHYNGVRFNSRERGIFVAEEVIRAVVGFEEEEGDDDNTKKNLPSFCEPHVIYAHLPIGYNYLYVNKPKYRYEELGKDVASTSTRFPKRRIVISTIDDCQRSYDSRHYTDIYDVDRDDISCSDDDETEQTQATERAPESRSRRRGSKAEVTNRRSIYDMMAYDSERVPELTIIMRDRASELQKLMEGPHIGGEYGIEELDEAQGLKLRKSKSRLNPRKSKSRLNPRKSLQLIPTLAEEEKKEKKAEKPLPEHFEMEIDQFCEISSITLFTKRKFAATDYIKLCGLHYTYLGDAFYQNLAYAEPKDIFKYFEGPRCVALFHPYFKTFTRNLREYLPTIKTRNDTEIELYNACEKYGYKEFMQKELDSFFKKNRSIFPMYNM